MQRPDHLLLVVLLIGLATLATSSGCRKQGLPKRVPPAARARNLLNDASGQLVEETWDVHYIRDAKIGHRHTRVFREDSPTGSLLRIEATDNLEVRRFGDVVRQELTSVSLEKPTGEVQQLAYRIVNGDSMRSASGVVREGAMELEVAGAESNAKTRYAWPADQGGIFAIERSLLRQPMQVGEKRSLSAFLPLLDRMVRQDLVAVRAEKTSIGETEEELLRVEGVDPLTEGWKLPTIYWCRPDGAIVKSKEAFLDRETVRATEEQATQRNDLVRVDLGVDIGVKLKKPILNPLAATHAVYRVKVEDVDPQIVFANCLSQRVISGGDHSALITVSQITPVKPPELDIAVDEPTNDDLAPNAIIQSDHPRVIALANAVAETIEDPWQAAVMLENTLFRMLGKEDFSQVFSSAGEVAVSRKGDCSEHAVLLAATCRARGIPARVAIGLFYTQSEQSFLYHMWTEVWIKDRWIPLDATLGNGGIGGCHLKLRDSSLAHQSPYALVSPVIYLIGKLQIEPVDVGR